MKHRNYASDNVKFLNQSTIERLLKDDNCYSKSSGEYDEAALRERLIELKTAKAQRIGEKGYDEMLMVEEARHGACDAFMTAKVNRYLKTAVKHETTETVVEAVKPVKRQYKFIIRW